MAFTNTDHHVLQGPWRRDSLRRAAARVPAGRWGVAVSGGADSVATLRLLLWRARVAGDVSLLVIHLDHELRGRESAEDAAFVAQLAADAGLPCFLQRRTQLEAAITAASPAQPAAPAPANLAARMRRLRLDVYAQAVARFSLDGVILGHHADDVAETLLLRLLRGSPRSGTQGLAPLRFEQTVGGVRLLRPMLRVRRRRLRALLRRIGQQWREDASNATDSLLRNRIRRLLADRPEVIERLLALSCATEAAEACFAVHAPPLGDSPRVADIAAITAPLARRALRRWLVSRGVPESAAGPAAVDRLMDMLDAAGPRAADFAGAVRVLRRSARLVAQSRSLP